MKPLKRHQALTALSVAKHFKKWRTFLAGALLVVQLPALAESYSLGLLDAQPFGWQDEQGNYQGVTYHNLMALIERVDPGAETSVMMATSYRLSKAMLADQVDVLISAWFQGLEDNAIKLGPIVEISVELWRVLGDQTPDPYSGVLAINKYYSTLPELEGGDHIVGSIENKTAVRMLMAGRVDGIVSSAISLCEHAKLLGLSPADFQRHQVRTIPVYLWLNNNAKITRNKQKWQAAADWLTEETAKLDINSYCAIAPSKGDTE